MCCTWLAGNTGRKNYAKNCHLRTIAQYCWAASSQLRHVSTIIGKNLSNSNMPSTCPRNMVNFGPLRAEIGPTVWGIPTNFRGFRVVHAWVTAVTSLIGGQPNFARCLAVSCAGTLYIHFRGLLPPDRILPGAQLITSKSCVL